MVLNDDHIHSPVKKKQSTYKLVDHFSAAHLYDRFAAFIIDYSIILSPLIWLFVSPFKKQLGVLALTGESYLNSFVFLNITVVLVVISFLYNFFFTLTFGSTLGQIFLKLKVKSITVNQGLSAYDVFVRSLVFTISILFLGIPILFLFLHQGQRTLHELVSDTYTVSLVKNRPVKLQNVFFFRSVSVLILIFMFVGFALSIKTYLAANINNMTQVDENFCEEVTEAVKTWPSQKEVVPKRLSVAMALYAIDGMDKNCLKKEADYVFDSGEDSELAYLAKAFVHAGEAKRSDLYLDKVCELDKESEACQMSKVIDGWASDEYSNVNQILSGLDSDSAYVNLWKTRFYMSQGNYTESARVINKLPKVKAMSRFASLNKVKLHWFNEKKELAMTVLDSVLERENNDDSYEISSWHCSEELLNSCSNTESPSCQYIDSTKKKEDNIAELAQLQQLDCNDELGTYTRYNWSDETKKLINYMNSSKDKTDQDLISFIEDNLFINKNIPLLAISKHIQNKESLDIDLINTISSLTGSLKIDYQKKSMRNKVVDSLLQAKNYTQAFAYGKNFLENSSETFIKKMIVSSYMSGEKDLSKQMLAVLNSFEDEELKYSRSIASEDDFSVVKKMLEESED